ncbi:MAG: GNVR domain-containing protein, partial [Melioribacteraceae bacterium]|nr:GNVR domain-containing protein [Melioribacteraceae bacterium]
ATERLNKLIDVEVTKERILILSVTLSTGYFSRFSDEVDSVAALSASTANEFIIVLDEINREKLNQKAKNTRLFIEQQLETTKEKLKLAEDSLLNFQKVNKTISIPEQLQASLDNAAGIKSEILFTEIKLNTLDYNMLETSPEYLSLQKKLKVLNETYNNLITRESGKENDFLPAFEDVPQLAIELARLTREVKVQNELYLLLQKQFYKERIQENKDIPTVQVLDAAIVPMRPVSPRLFFSTFFIFVAALFLISSYYIFLETRKINKEKNN